MNDFNFSHCYGPSTIANSNRKTSRSDLVFQKLKKYEEKYKTNRSLNRGLVETDSESDIEQYKPIVQKYTGPLQDLTTNRETSIDSPPKGETVAVVESSDYRPHAASNKKSLVIDLKVDDAHLVKSDDSKAVFITNSFKSVSQDRNYMSPKKSCDASVAAAEQHLIEKTTTSSLKTLVNNNLVDPDTLNDLNNQHRHIMLHDYHTDSDCGHVYSNSSSKDKKLLIHDNIRNESKKVDLYITDEMPVEYSLKENENVSLKQINCVPLSNGEKTLEEPESIRTEIFQSNSEVTSYEVPDIFYSYDMGLRQNSESSHVDIVVSSESSVSSVEDMTQNTCDKTATVPASNNVTDVPSNSVISSCTKRDISSGRKCKSQTEVTHHYRKTKSTQTNTNLNFLHHTNDNNQHPNTVAEEDVVLSPYSLFVYHYLLHGYPQDHKEEDTDCAVRFLNKCLMEQVSITQHLINSHQATYNAYCKAARNLSKNYQPITLENTMKYIKQSKKKQRNKMVSP